MPHLTSIDIPQRDELPDRFPFSLPFVRGFARLEIRTPVTILVGENGSGKSTLLEAVAASVGLSTVGGESVERDPSLVHARALGDVLRLGWQKKTRRGFFMRAEDFFNFAKRVRALQEEMQDMAAEFDNKFTGTGRMLAAGMARGQQAALRERYGEDLDAQSHGESFLKLFQSRFVPEGLYLMDEPEAPLSPQRQLTLLAMLLDMTSNQGAQFIIATHSPILMAFPEAVILSFDHVPLEEVQYDDVEHVALTRRFLEAPERFLRHL